MRFSRKFNQTRFDLILRESGSIEPAGLFLVRCRHHYHPRRLIGRINHVSSELLFCEQEHQWCCLDPFIVLDQLLDLNSSVARLTAHCANCASYGTDPVSGSVDNRPIGGLFERCIHVIEFGVNSHSEMPHYRKACHDYQRWHVDGLINPVGFYRVFKESGSIIKISFNKNVTQSGSGKYADC